MTGRHDKVPRLCEPLLDGHKRIGKLVRGEKSARETTLLCTNP